MNSSTSNGRWRCSTGEDETAAVAPVAYDCVRRGLLVGDVTGTWAVKEGGKIPGARGRKGPQADQSWSLARSPSSQRPSQNTTRARAPSLKRASFGARSVTPSDRG